MALGRAGLPSPGGEGPDGDLRRLAGVWAPRQREGTRDGRPWMAPALDLHWAASDANDFDAEHRIYREDAVLEYPQSGERIRGRHGNTPGVRSRSRTGNASRCGASSAPATCGSPNSCSLTTTVGGPTVSIMEFEGGKVARADPIFRRRVRARAFAHPIGRANPVNGDLEHQVLVSPPTAPTHWVRKVPSLGDGNFRVSSSKDFPGRAVQLLEHSFRPAQGASAGSGRLSRPFAGRCPGAREWAEGGT